MNKPNFKKYTKEEALAVARKMVQTKRDWANVFDQGNLCPR